MYAKSAGMMPTWNDPVPSDPASVSNLSAIIASLANTHTAYLAIMQLAALSQDGDLGGSLLYVGELDEAGSTWATAANIAGTATLAASADSQVLRLAQRGGVIDFLVNSLDEALRILKNEIRKRQPVAVAVSKTPAAIEEEMLERGVLPNVLPPQLTTESAAIRQFLVQGARSMTTPSRDGEKSLHVWAAPPEFAQNVAAFEALVGEQLAHDDHLNLRWLRSSPRYLGAEARRLRSIACDDSTAKILSEKIGKPVFTANR